MVIFPSFPHFNFSFIGTIPRVIMTAMLNRDLRARLELCLNRLVEVCSNVDCRLVEEKAGTEDEIPTDTEFLVRSPQVTAMVRKELAVCIRDLIHHGLGQTRPGAGLLPFSGCMSGM